jgi:DNA-binding response OmpR family regulator
MVCKGLSLNLNDTFITYEDKSIELTKNEFKIIKLLIENEGKVVTRQALMKSLWDDEVYVNENTLTVNVNRLRMKLEDLGLKDFITTKKGMGYIII